jgi:acylphosphatase
MKLKIKITGKKVHGVGYRPWLTDAAIDAGIMGFYVANRIENKEQVVIVLAEGDEWSLSHFEELLRNSRPELANVDRIDTEDYAGDIMSLDKYATINTCSQMNKAIPLLLSMNNKMDQMLGKQDETISEIRDLRDDLVIHSSANRLSRIEKDIRSIKAKIEIQ